MCHQKIQSFKFSFLLLILVATTWACSDKEEEVTPGSPAYFISESEKLTIPDEVKVPDDGKTRVATYFATGVQKYKAQVKTGTTGTLEWAFVSPRADLFDSKNVRVGTHYAGPSWELITSTKDMINGQAFSPPKTKSVDANSIDWLLLMPKTGTTPTGVFKDVAYIQRISTVGGKAPSDAPTDITQTTEVSYTAIYRFTKKD